MKVLHLNTHTSGGSYEYAALLSTALTEHGIESRVLTQTSGSLGARKPFLDRVVRRAYISFSTEPWHGTGRLLSPPSSVELNGIDVVHLHTVADWFNVPKWLKRLPSSIGVVASLHDMWHVSGGCFLYRGCDLYAREADYCDPCPILRWPANRLFARDEYSRKLHAYRNCGTRMVANSHWLAEVAGRSAIAKACGGIRVVLPAVDTAFFNQQDKGLCRKHLGLSTDAFVIVTGGGSLNDSNKNVPWLFEQLTRLPNLGTVIVLAFGDGTVPVPAGLNVRFTGGIRERPELARLFAAADVFVSASLMETYGLALVEAMACGTPVVAFRVGGIPEAAPDRKVGILCDPLDGAAFVSAIQELRGSARIRAELGTAASKLVAIRNNKARFAAEFVQLYEDCLNSARNPFTRAELAKVSL